MGNIEDLIRMIETPPREPQALTWREAEKVLAAYKELEAQIAPLRQDLNEYVVAHRCQCTSNNWCTRCRIMFEMEEK